MDSGLAMGHVTFCNHWLGWHLTCYGLLSNLNEAHGIAQKDCKQKLEVGRSTQKWPCQKVRNPTIQKCEIAMIVQTQSKCKRKACGNA